MNTFSSIKHCTALQLKAMKNFDAAIRAIIGSIIGQCIRPDGEGCGFESRPLPGPRVESSSASDTESDYSTLDDANPDKEPYRLGGKLCVANLARCPPRVLSNRSNMYLWNVLTVMVFYTLPVIQLVITYQRLLNQSGNQDLCYFNFLCAHPLMFLSDFNHVYSNLGYVLLGLLFLMQVWRRHKNHREKTPAQKELGIPQHFGLMYAMGVALVSEGILSAAYHVCPNSMNFQFGE
ncbi:hypothetical protein evm_015008 [Chilo suppressalis]|nr:hypothetical protein evm_015008 [Chilo suppressalis]